MNCFHCNARRGPLAHWRYIDTLNIFFFKHTLLITIKYYPIVTKHVTAVFSVIVQLAYASRSIAVCAHSYTRIILLVKKQFAWCNYNTDTLLWVGLSIELLTITQEPSLPLSHSGPSGLTVWHGNCMCEYCFTFHFALCGHMCLLFAH